MKKLLSILLLIYSNCYSGNGKDFLFSGINAIEKKIKSDNGFNHSNVINQFDTIVFDISQAIFTFNSVEIPVKVLSNDSVLALDFSFKYNMNNMSFDTIIDLTTYMHSNSYFNTADSTVRYTSYSFPIQNYTLDTPLVFVKFTLLNGMIGINDINSMVGWLNGDRCTILIRGFLPSTVENNIIPDISFNYFPSPADKSIQLITSADFNVHIADLSGKMNRNYGIVKKDTECIIDIDDFSNGIYLINLFDGKQLIVKKMIVQH